MSKPKIRLLEKTDIPTCLELAIECFKMQLTKKELKAMEVEFQLPFKKFSQRPIMFVATIRNKIVGMAGYSQSMMDWEAYEFFWLCVSPKHRAKGIGPLLSKTREDHIVSKTPSGDSVTILFSSLVSVAPYHERNGYKVFIEKAGGEEVIMGKTFISSAFSE